VRLRFPIAARLTLMLSAIALLTLLLEAAVRDRSLSHRLNEVATQRLEKASLAADRLLGRHLRTVTERTLTLSRTPELRAHLEVGHRPTLDHAATQLAGEIQGDVLMFLDVSGRVRAGHGNAALGRSLRQLWTARASDPEAHCVGIEVPRADLAEPFRPCGSDAEPRSTLHFFGDAAAVAVHVPLYTGERRVGALLTRVPLGLETLGDWSELVGAEVFVRADETPESRGEHDLLGRVRRFDGFEVGIRSSLAPELSALASARRDQLFAGYVALALALAMSALLARDFLRPIREIRKVTRQVGRGRLEARVGTLRGDEIGDVGRALDDTLDRLEHSQRRLRSVQRIARFGDWSADLEAGLVDGSPQFYRVLQLESEDPLEVEGFLGCFHLEDRERLERAMARCAVDGTRIELDLRRPSATATRIVHLAARRLDAGDGPSRQLQGSVQDVTDRRRAEEQIRFLAYHDSLTGLPNRRFLNERLALAVSPGQSRPFSLLFFDLDRFKLINDTLGHSVGDDLLCSVAARLTKKLSNEEGVSLARFGGDEFVLLLPDVVDAEAIESVGSQFLAEIARPFHLQGFETVVTCSAGVARWPRDGESVEALLRSCDTALHRAKETERNRVCLYDPSMEQEASERWKLENRLRRAIETHQFEIYYQARVRAEDQSLSGLEALLRWPEFGYGPNDFVPIAEETGLIVPLGAWVIESVAEQIQRWSDQGLRVPWVSVNVSGRQLTPEIVEVFRSALDSGLDPDRLEVEVTESALMGDTQRGIAALEGLRELGLRIYLDDFGTGYSSLSYLRNLPITGVKIDRSFVRSIHTDEQGAALVGSIVSMAKVLGLSVVAEGVETEEQAEWLTEIGCDELQGHLFGQAAPGEDAERRLRELPVRKRQRPARPD